MKDPYSMIILGGPRPARADSVFPRLSHCPVETILAVLIVAGGLAGS